MLTNAAITIYHLDDDEEGYTRVQYPRVSLHQNTKVAAAHNGIVYDNLFKIRIPTDEHVGVDIGDYVCFGLTDAASPDKAACNTVVGFSDNRRGSLPHWRIECK